MSSETVVKKRGRPRKADKIDPASGRQDGEVVTTPKRCTTSRSITTTKLSSKDAVPKKSARRKKIAEIDGTEAPNEQLVVEVDSPSTAKERQSEPSKSRILDEARAFKELKASSAASTQISASADEQLEASSNNTGLQSNSASSPAASQSLRPARNITASEPPSSIYLSPESSSSTPTEDDATRSSFLSSFLSDTPDSIPEAPESSRITDRSAFNAQSLSVDDIVSGEGVSDLTSLTAAAQPKANAKQQRESAIPITAAKSFKSHSLNTFPDKPEQQKVKTPSAKKYIDPEIYALGSFRKFKTSPPATAAPSASVSNSAGTTVSTKQSPHIPPTSTLSQIQSKSQHNQKATIQTSSAPTSTPTPTPSNPQQQPPTPSTPSTIRPIPPSASSARLPNPHVPPSSTSEPQFRPKRPTEMTPAELLKNPEFKSLRRKYTGLIVGIPVLVVTSWLLWERMDREDKGLSLGEIPVVEEKRRRGELPRRILDDGGLERGR